MSNKIKEIEDRKEQSQLKHDQTNYINNSKWSYLSGSGEANIIDNSGDVTIFMSYKPNSAPRPHYRVSLIRKNNILTGTWICLIKGFRGCGKTNNIKFKIDPSGQSIIVVQGEDPDGHGLKRGFTLYRI